MSSKFEYITSNVYVCRQPAREDPDDVDKCDCREKSDGPICFDSGCPNVATRKECVFCSRSRCQNQRLRAGVWKNLERFKTGTSKDYGLRTLEPIAAGEFIIEYVGEVIDQAELDVRMREYSTSRHLYLISLGAGPSSKQEYLDGFNKGSLARYLNHSCAPNCTSEVWEVQGENRLKITALRPIAAGEELTIDYQWGRVGFRRVRCKCGSPVCCGFIGGVNTMTDDEFCAPTAGYERAGPALMDIVCRVRPLGDSTAAWDIGVFTSFDAEHDEHLFNSFMSHKSFSLVISRVQLQLYAPDAPMLTEALTAAAAPAAVFIPRRGDEQDDVMYDRRSPFDRSNMLVPVQQLLPSAALPVFRSTDSVTPSPSPGISATVDDHVSTPVQMISEEQRAKDAERERLRKELKAKYELDRQLEELARQERLDEEDEQRILAIEAENERRRVEWEKEMAARRFADELARLEADVASLPPSATVRQQEVATTSDDRAAKDGSGNSKPSKKRTAVDAGLQHAAAAASTSLPLVKQKQKLYAKPEEIGKQGFLFPFMPSWKFTLSEATKHSASARAGVLEGDEWVERRCAAALIRKVCEILHLESVVIARALLLCIRFYSSYPVRTTPARLDTVVACIVHLALRTEKSRKDLEEVVRACRNAVSLSSVTRCFEPLLSSSPAFPGATSSVLETSNVLALQPLVLAHLRYDVTPPDPMIVLEKALKKSVSRKLGSGAGPVLQDAEAAFMSRVSGLSLESPDRRHKAKRHASQDAAAGKHDDADLSDDDKDKKEHSGHTPVAEAAVALLFRSLECQPHLWLVWDNDSIAYGLLHMLAAFAAASNDGERRSWFRPGVDPRVGVAVFGPSAAVLHDVLHDLLKPPPVFLRPEISDFLFDLGKSQAALRLGLSWIGTPVTDDGSPLFPFKRRHPIAFEKSMLPYRVADTRSLPRSVGCFKFLAQVGPSSFVCEEALTKDGAPGRTLLLQQWPVPATKALTEGFALSSVRTIKALQELHLPKASEDAAAAEDAGKSSKEHKKLSKKEKKLKKHKKEKDSVADPRETIAAGQSLVHVSRCPNLLLPLEIVVGSDTFAFPAGANPVPSSLPPDVAEAAQALLRGAFIVYEFAKHDVPGLLIGSVRLSADVPLSFRQKLSYQLALAVRRLHSRGLVAQSLNPSQLLMSSDGTLRLFRPDWPRSVPAESTDALSMLMAAPAHSFLSGLARFSASNKDAAFKVVSAPPHVHASLCAAEVMPFVAPEVLLGLPCGLPANDQWSLGACLYYIHTGACLISGATPVQVLDSAFALVGSPGTLVDGLPLWPAGTVLPAFAATAAVPTVPTALDYSLSCLCPELADLIRGLLRIHPSARLTSKQVLSHPYFTKFVPPGAVATPLAAEVPSLRMPLHPYLLHPLFR